jgi:hypothetical protein
MTLFHLEPPVSIALLAVLMLGLLPAWAGAQDASRLPDWKGQWIRTGSGSFDPGKPPGIRQSAPLTPEYQALLEETAAAQANGGQGNDPMARCVPPGMPRMMINYGLGMEFVLTPETTYLVFGEPMRQLRRIYTDGRDWPAGFVPTFSGYSAVGRETMAAAMPTCWWSRLAGCAGRAPSTVTVPPCMPTTGRSSRSACISMPATPTSSTTT